MISFIHHQMISYTSSDENLKKLTPVDFTFIQVRKGNQNHYLNLILNETDFKWIRTFLTFESS